MNYESLPLGDNAPERVNAVIEIPAGSVNKYEYDKKLGIFRLDRPLYSPVHYPGDYGFIPSTLAEDGDPADILILVANPTFPGCLVEARVVGMLEMIDQGERDTKILAVSEDNPRYQEVCNYTDVYTHVLREIEHFFTIYKELEGKQTRLAGWKSFEDARKLIMESHERYEAKRKAA